MGAKEIFKPQEKTIFGKIFSLYFNPILHRFTDVFVKKVLYEKQS